MQVYEIGPDNSEYGRDNEYDFVIVFYENYGYEGGGIALGFKADGTVDKYNLSHCSCYGPHEAGPNTTLSKNEFLNLRENDIDIPARKRSKDDFDNHRWEAIFVQYDKVMANDQ